MTYKLLLAATLSLGLGTGIALAQSDTTTDSTLGATPDATVGSGLPAGWDGAIGDAFFSDTDAGVLRSEDEIRANFNTLTETQQAEVRDHCQTYDTASADSTMQDSMDSSGTDSTVTGSTTADSSASAAGDPMITASIERACGWINSM